MEKNPWYHNVNGPFIEWQGPTGVKADGGGCTRGHGRVGNMVIHRAVCNRNLNAIVRAVDDGENVNEVEGAGNTPLHNAAYEGWVEGAQLLLSLGAKMDASNNAGDRPWHWARNMGQVDMMKFLEKVSCRSANAQFTSSMRMTFFQVQVVSCIACLVVWNTKGLYAIELLMPTYCICRLELTLNRAKSWYQTTFLRSR